MNKIQIEHELEAAVAELRDLIIASDALNHASNAYSIKSFEIAITKTKITTLRGKLSSLQSHGPRM